MISRIFDCHLHIDSGLGSYNLNIVNANVIFNDVNQYILEKDKFTTYYKTLIFDFKDNFDFVVGEIFSNHIHAIKIHSRRQQISENDYCELLSLLKSVNKNIPIIYDAFYYGNALEFQPSLKGLLYLVKELPNTNFIVAHAGGYKALEYFFHLSGLSTFAFDLSFSLQ